jgi:hypothetical protein
MQRTPSRSILLVVLTTIVSCTEELPPPPELSVTSPKRGLIQSDAGQVVVEGTAQPGPSGSPVTKVMVNDMPVKLAADGSFTAVVAVPAGAMLLETVAVSEEGGKAIDARAMHVGQLRPTGTRIDRAVYATLSAPAFARVSEAASQILNTTDLSALLAPVNLGDQYANLKLTINNLEIGNAKIALTPVDGGLKISVELNGFSVVADAAYGGVLVPDGSTSVKVTADKIAIGGTLVVTPVGNAGLKTTISSPVVSTKGLRLEASGLAGRILDLLNDNLASTIRGIATRSVEGALEPLINKALGALGGPKQLDVLGKTVTLEGSFSEVKFSNAGALASLSLQARIGGSESSPGYIFTPNGTPSLEMGHGIQLALADDLLNDMLAQVHALRVLDLHLEGDFGLFDSAKIELMLPPMISANTGDGSVRLVLGDMIATVANDGATLVRAAINAQVDVAIDRGTNASEIALRFGKVHLVVNLLDDPANPSEISPAELAGAANAGIGLQLDSLREILVTVPAPTVAGVTLDNLSLHGDRGYLVGSGQIH